MRDTDGVSADVRDQDEFYIGYARSMPPRLARFVSIAVVAGCCGVTALAIAVAAGHTRLEGGIFEFGHPQAFSGTIIERPYPVLTLDGNSAPTTTSLLLVAPGKHGTGSLVAGFDGHHVSLKGTRILRGGRTMLEVDPESIEMSTNNAEHGDQAVTSSIPGASTIVTGEVVDSKCFMGVMVPGDGKTHADCAALCLRGGIPPALSIRDKSARSALVLLAGAQNEAIGPRLSEFAGEAVEVSGVLERTADWPVMRMESMRRK